MKDERALVAEVKRLKTALNLALGRITILHGHVKRVNGVRAYCRQKTELYAVNKTQRAAQAAARNIGRMLDEALAGDGYRES